jgi:bifunctional DNase/RNase
MKCDEKGLIPVKILSIYPHAELQNGTFMVFLKGEKDKRIVAITIGRNEGQALVLAVKQIRPPRPLTHNLLRDFLGKIKAKVHRLVIHTMKDGIFHAYLLVQTSDEVFHLDCRSNDGMILATLMETPIYLSQEVMEEVGLEFEAPEISELNPGSMEKFLVSGMGELCKPDKPSREAGEGKIAQSGEDPAEVETEEVVPGKNELEILKAQLNRLIAEEAYEEAAKIRDRISELESK